MVARDLSRDDGAVSSEYALLAVLIAVAIVVAVGALGEAVFDLYDSDELIGALGGDVDAESDSEGS